MMVSVLHCLKGEYEKSKHSILRSIHWIIPFLCAVIFAGYYHVSVWEKSVKISTYLETLAVAFPFLTGIIVGMAVQIENQAGHFQLMLGTIPSRTAPYIGKLGFLIINAFGATFLALGVFVILYREAPAVFCMKAGLLLVATMVPVYMIQLMTGVNFGKGASMGLGIAGSLISALMITGLGDIIWKYIPWAWGVRAMEYLVLAWNKPYIYEQIKQDFFHGMAVCIVCSGVFLIVSLLWFRNWEGKNLEG